MFEKKQISECFDERAKRAFFLSKENIFQIA